MQFILETLTCDHNISWKGEKWKHMKKSMLQSIFEQAIIFRREQNFWGLERIHFLSLYETSWFLYSWRKKVAKWEWERDRKLTILGSIKVSSLEMVVLENLVVEEQL